MTSISDYYEVHKCVDLVDFDVLTPSFEYLI